MNLSLNIFPDKRKAFKQLGLKIKQSLLFTLIAIQGIGTAKAQAIQYTRPSWWFGVAGGANINFYRGSTQKLNSDFTVPAVFHDGTGVGLFVAPLIEYYKPNTRFGMMFQLGFDGKSSKYNQILTPCNCPADLSVKLNYVTIEPSLRFAPFKSGFYLYAGPRFAFNMAHSFKYQQSINPDYPEQTPNPEVKGDLSDVNKTLISMQVGAGYDIQLSSLSRHTQFVISPFIAFQPYFGQSPRSTETWNITTLRAGAAFKFGRGHIAAAPEDKVVKTPVKEENKKEAIVPAIQGAKPVLFNVQAPLNLFPSRTVTEVFPLRNYIFFDLGSNEIPKRYVLIKKEQVNNFKVNQVVLTTPENLSGRSERQMIVYYNILNILGDRMIKNPVSTITLVGSSEEGSKDGLIMAERIKTYLVDVFGISSTRIKTEGGLKPKLPSEKPGQTKDLEMLKEGDRRVSIETNTPALLAEFESGLESQNPKPAVVTTSAGDVLFNVEGSKKHFTSWSLQTKDLKGNIRNYGPFTEDKTTIPSSTILGTRSEGTYLMTMTGTKPDGSTISKDTSVYIVHYIYSTNVVVKRFSVIYEYDESKSIAMYRKYLIEKVIPQIPKGATIVLHGFTDILGDVEYNRKLSLARANDVKKIMEDALAEIGRTDVKFEIFGYGEDQSYNRYGNNLPEERFYNRGVTIDILEKI